MLLFHSQNVLVKKKIVKNGLRWKPIVGDRDYWASGSFLLDYPAESKLTVTFYTNWGTYCELSVLKGTTTSSLIYPSWSTNDKVTSIRNVTITPASDDNYIYYYRGVAV